MIIELIGYIDSEIEIWGEVEQEEELISEIFDATSEPIPVYEGDYTIVPRVVEQIFDTDNKLMINDFTVLEIPYHEVSNLSGVTAIIGGI